MTNYTIIQNETITSYLSDKAFRLYTLLESMAYGSKIQVYPSQRFLACALRCSVRTIQRALTELKKFNLISIKRRGSISNVYYLLQKKVQQTIENIKDKAKSRENGSKEKKYAKETKNTDNKNNNYSTSVKKDKFNDFEQRDYDFNKLENLLLNRNGNLSDCLIKQE
ncbi:transcriptional regulator [Clostridium botulinum]